MIDHNQYWAIIRVDSNIDCFQSIIIVLLPVVFHPCDGMSLRNWASEFCKKKKKFLNSLKSVKWSTHSDDWGGIFRRICPDCLFSVTATAVRGERALMSRVPGFKPTNTPMKPFASNWLWLDTPHCALIVGWKDRQKMSPAQNLVLENRITLNVLYHRTSSCSWKFYSNPFECKPRGRTGWF